jgi:hypothetical protein
MNKSYAEENAIERQKLFMLTDKPTEADGEGLVCDEQVSPSGGRLAA